MAITNVSARAPRRRENLSDNGMDSERRRGPSKFSKGAVWRLRLVNFLVYEDTFVEFGPRLNVVIGPNGCGKSTLVCAITLGLGGSPKVKILTYLCFINPFSSKHRLALRQGVGRLGG